MSNSIELPRNIVNQILAHAQSRVEEEICGLISAKDGIAAACYPIENVSMNREDLFTMDGKAQIDAMREMRDKNEELYAIYHSHPHSEAFPSKTDLSESQYPDLIYLIVSLNTKGVLDLRGYCLANGGVETLEVHV